MESNCPWGPMSDSVHRLTCEAWKCGWIRQPNNVLSSLLYIGIGFLLLHQARKMGLKRLRTFALMSVLIGLGSILAHSGEIRFTGFFDFLFQFIFFGYLAHLRWPLPKERFNKVIIFQIILACLSMIWIHRTNIPWLGFLVGQAFFLEFKYLRDSKTRIDPDLLKGIVLFFAGLFFFTIDVLRIGCNPDNHFFQPHGLWHLGTAIGIYFVAHSYSRQHST